MVSTCPADVEFGFVVGGDVRLAARLDELGVESLWTGGHVASHNPSPEVMVNLARLSAVTTRARLGTSILLLPLCPPAIIAKQVADLDIATGGRLVLGIGVGGEYPQEFRAVQVQVADRGLRTDEAIPLVRRLWAGQEISHDGPFFPMQRVRIHPEPVQPGGPPIVVAGRKEPAMRRAARLGDGWFPYLYTPRRYAASVATIRAEAPKAGRDLQGFGWFVFVFVNVDADGDRARDQTARTLGGTYDQDFRKFVDHVTAAGTHAEVTRKLQDYVAAGARHLVLAPAVGATDAEPMIQRLLDDVIPAVRAAMLS